MSFIVSYARAHIRSAPKFHRFFFSARYAAAPGFTPRSILGSRILRRVRRGRTHGHRHVILFGGPGCAYIAPLFSPLHVSPLYPVSSLQPKHRVVMTPFFLPLFLTHTAWFKNRIVQYYVSNYAYSSLHATTTPPVSTFFLTHGGYTPPFILSYLPVCSFTSTLFVDELYLSVEGGMESIKK